MSGLGSDYTYLNNGKLLNERIPYYRNTITECIPEILLNIHRELVSKALSQFSNRFKTV